MVAQCADSTAAAATASPDPSSQPMENGVAQQQPSLHNIIIDVVVDHHHQQHQRQQQQFVFGTNLMQLVSNLLLKAFDRGQFAVVEQLLCWQEHSADWAAHTLSLLLNELRTTRHCCAAVALVRVVAQLLRTAPAQLGNQMKALCVDELMLSLRDRFVVVSAGSASPFVAGSDHHHHHHLLLLEEAIEDCLIHMTTTLTERHDDEAEVDAESTLTVMTSANSRTDADSGTFSGDEEEPRQHQQRHQQMPSAFDDGKKEADQQQQQQQQLDELVRLIHTLPARAVPLLAKFLRVTNHRSLGTTLISMISNSQQSMPCQPHQELNVLEKRVPVPPPPPPVPPPPPMLLSVAAASPRPSPCASVSPAPPPPPPPPPPPAVPLVRNPPPPPPPLASPAATACREPCNSSSQTEIPSALKPKALPDQCRRLRHLQWTKLPTNAVAATPQPTTTTTTTVTAAVAATVAATTNCAGAANVWQTMEAVDKEMRDRLDFTVLDAFFGCPSNTPSQNISSDIGHHRSTPSSASSASARRRSSMMLNGLGAVDSLVTLLDAKRSLSVNVFLKMCRDSAQLLNDLAEGKADKIGADRLRTISHLLPSADEQKLLRDFAGDKHALGAAEQFLLALCERIPAHRLRVDAMLFKLDLQAMVETTQRPTESGLGLKVWLKGCQELLCSSTLRKVLYALLHLGNYLNHGAGAGNAVGFRLSSLWKVEDVKTIGGTTRGRTLLHFVAQQVDNCAQELAAELDSVREAAKTSLEAISDDVRSLSERMHCLEEGIARTKFDNNNNSGAGGDDNNFLDEFLRFLEKSRHIIASAERQLAELGTLRRQVATFLCEQERNFSLEECFKVIAWFITRFEKAVEDNRRFMERDQQQQQLQQQQLEMGQQQFRKPSPDSLDGMALKSVAKKRERQSFALVEDERERQQQTPPSSCRAPPASPGKMRRRRTTAHSVTPLLDALPFLNGLEEKFVVEKSAAAADEVKDRKAVEQQQQQQSLEAVVDQALLMRRREIVCASRETKCTKIVASTEEEKMKREEQKEQQHIMEMMAQHQQQPQQQQVATKTTTAQQIVPQPPPQLAQSPSADKLVQQKAAATVRSPPPSPQSSASSSSSSALATMSTKAKKHLLIDQSKCPAAAENQCNSSNRQQQRGKVNNDRKVEERVVDQQQQLQRHGAAQAVPERVEGVQQQQQRFGTVIVAPSAAVVRTTAQQKRINNKLPTASVAASSKRGGATAGGDQSSSVCRIRIVTKQPNNNQQQQLSPGQKPANQQSSPATADRPPLKPSQVKASQPKVAKPSATQPTSSRRSTATTTSSSCSSSSNANVAGGFATQSLQQQQQHGRATKPTLIRRLSTSSRPTLVHPTGRSCTSTGSNREKGKPKWI